MLAPMVDTQVHERWRKLGWSALSKLVVAAAAAIGTKIGEKVVDAIVGEKPPPDDEDDPDEDEDDR